MQLQIHKDLLFVIRKEGQIALLVATISLKVVILDILDSGIIYIMLNSCLS